MSQQKTFSYTTKNKYVDCMDKLDLGTSYVIPATWFSTIKYESGKPNLNAMLVLSDIVYWYKSAPVYDVTGENIIGRKKKFSSDLLQRNYAQISEKFGFSKKQAITAVQALEDLGLIEKKLRTIKVNGISIPKVMFIKPIITKIEEITYPEHIVVQQGDSDNHIPCMSDANTYGEDDSTLKYEHIQETSSRDFSESLNCSFGNEPKKERTKNTDKEAEELFEALWKKYPVKRGKGSVKISTKRKLLGYGYEQMARCVDRYVSEIKRLGKEAYFKDGSTFFNSGYVDFLDENYQERPKLSGGNGNGNTPNRQPEVASQYKWL